MKKILLKYSLLLLVIISSNFSKINAQPGRGISYIFSMVNGNAPAMPPGLTNVVIPAASQNDTAYLLAPGGMNIKIGGRFYTQCIVSTNGWVALCNGGPIPPALVAGGYLNTNALATYSGGLPIFAPYWDDLATSIISYIYTGGALWVRWTAKLDKNAPAAANCFWVKIDGTNGVIDFIYANLGAYVLSAPPPSASIGLAGICPGDYYSFNGGSLDSTVETSNISTKPNFARYTFTPYQWGDNCVNANDLGTIGATCTASTGIINNATSSGSGICSTTDVADAWYKIVKPAGIANVIITTSPSALCQPIIGTSIEVFSLCGGASLGCATTGSSAGFGEITVSRGSCAAETLYIRVTSDGDLGGKFNICIKDAGPLPGLAINCSNPNWICALPYNSGLLTTAGSVDDFDDVSSPCHTTYMNGEDYFFAYTAVVSGCIKVTLNSTGVNPGVFVYSGCPFALGTSCLASAEIATGIGVINSVALKAGQTYYIVVDNDPSNGNTDNPFSLNVVTAGTPAATYDDCVTPFDLGTITAGVSCTPQVKTTFCATPSPLPYPVYPTCAPSLPIFTYVDGVTGDVWLKFVAGYTGPLQINTDVAAINTTSNLSMAVYQGSCGGALLACDYNSGPGEMPSLSIPIVLATTYYIRLWTENPDNQGDFNICFVSSCSPPNDFPCTATLVSIGGFTLGNNACATDDPLQEPGNAAACVAGGGTVNTVWFKAIVPASGLVLVRTNPQGLTDTEMQGFYFNGPGGCASAANVLTTVRLTCNHLGIPCTGGSTNFSEFTYSGIPGETLYVAVDGVLSATGTFNISFVDGSINAYPPVYHQDCAALQVVCSTTDIVVPEPGYSGNGNVCDIITGIVDTTNNALCFGGNERNSSWYQFTVDPALSGGTATVSFDILSQPTSDVNFAIWDVTGFANACSSITNAGLPATVCNGYGISDSTGLSLTGLGSFGGLDPYSPSLIFSGLPRTFIMLLTGFNPVPAFPNGYTLDWGTTPMASASSVTWDGNSDTLYTTLGNWGTCGPVPNCAVDAMVIPTVNNRYPTVLAGPTKLVRNLTVASGATLTLAPGALLQVCGNLDIQNGATLNCGAGSTIEFTGTGVTPQTISGILTGGNKFANLKITKTIGSVQLLTNIDVNENFTTTNGTSIFNILGKYMKVGGNFSNANGNTTFTGIGGSTVEFDSTINQNFTNTSGTISLNRVVMNKPLNRLSLTGANSTMNIDSILTLTSGIITTRALAALEVNVKYNLPAAIVGQNTLSYIDGKLRRKISNGPAVSGSYHFPVGNIVSAGRGGYEKAVINFTTTTTIPDLLATFTSWTPPNGPVSSECNVANYNVLPIFDNGYWTFSKSSAINTGNYNVTLHNQGYPNNAGNGWTVGTADILANPLLPASWNLFGTCVPGSIPDSVKRDLLNPGAIASTSFNHLYATLQTPLRLPIELLYFIAEPQGEEVLCKWETASETNNAYFEVERSMDGSEFIAIDKVIGYGNGISSEIRKYSFVDHELCEDIRYYRLKQVDINGDFTYSKPVAINCKRSSSIDLYPNPANTVIKYQFYYPEKAELTVNILDISGRLVRSEKIIALKGFNQITNRIEELAPGVYNLRITGTERGNVMLQKQFFKN